MSSLEDHERPAYLRQAYKVTQRFYEEFPPQRDLSPLFEAASAWPIVCGAFIGIETTMKHLLTLAGKSYPRGRDGHDILKLYDKLNERQKRTVTTYFNVYRSLHFDTLDPAVQEKELQSAGSFIRNIAKGGGGYEGWRYMLIEDPEKAPRVHIGLMLEIWRALLDVSWGVCRPVARLLAVQVERLADDAEESDLWQSAAAEASVNFGEVRDWFSNNGGYLRAGIVLFDALYKRRETLPGASQLCAKVLLDAAMETAGKETPDHNINAFRQRIRESALIWDTDAGLFRNG